MHFAVLLALTVSLNVLVNGDISWQHGHSPLSYGSSKLSIPSYESRRNHIKAKYYAQKAHDLAKLRSSIYGIGHGLYGFRYGSLFPMHFSKPLMPFIDKYPPFDLGLHYPSSHHIPHHFFLEPPSFLRISGLLTGFGYPKSYHSSYSHGYSYGKGYSYGNKHSYGYHKPHTHYYSGLKSPLPLSVKYIKKKYPGETFAYESEREPKSHGYQYSYVKETPGDFKFISSPSLGGYDSIYGIRYNDFGRESNYGKFPAHVAGYRESDYGKFPAHAAGYESDVSDYGKFPAHASGYESDVSIKSQELIPFSDVELAHGGHDGSDYSPLNVQSYDNFRDITSQDDIHSLNLDTSPISDKFDSSDLIAYGSEKSNAKIKDKN